MVVFGQKWLYSGKSGCTLAKVVVFGQSDCIPANWLFSVKVVVFGKMIVFWQKWLYSGKEVVFGQKWLYSGKSGCFPESFCNWAKVVVFGQKGL